MAASRPLVVRTLWRYPVKSMGGEVVPAARVTPTGIEGDRSHGIVELATATVLTARREPRLLFASASWAHGVVVVRLPDGTETDDDAVLSAWLGRDVALRRAGDEGGTYEVPLTVDVPTEGDETDWVSWTGPGGAWHDSARARVSLVSTASLGTWDARRFRANVVLDGDGEDELVGRRISLGTARLEVVKRIDRCVVVTRPQPGLPRDLDVLRAVNAGRDRCLAVGATVDAPGHIAVGDAVSAA
jgi:hypothetical protein